MKKRNVVIGASYSEARRAGDKMEFLVHGNSSKGAPVSATIKCSWYFIPYFIDSMKVAWEKERTRRINEINSIDASLPKS